MTDTNYIKVFSGNFIIVQMIVERLEAVGIRAIVKDESESSRLAGFGSSFQGFQELFVSEEELPKANAVIEVAESDMETQKNPE